MNMFKIALASAASLGLALAGTANAEPIRAQGSFPSVVSAKKIITKKISTKRSKAPAGAESNASYGVYSTIPLAIAAAGLAGLTTYLITKNDNGFEVTDSPAG
ncbi:MAG: hypothetical protein ACKVOL_12295 [Novosphingobium sp.]